MPPFHSRSAGARRIAVTSSGGLSLFVASMPFPNRPDPLAGARSGRPSAVRISGPTGIALPYGATPRRRG